MKNNDSKVVKFWSTHEPDEKNYYCSSITRPHIIRTAYGPDLIDQYCKNPYFAEDIFFEQHLLGRKIESILSICCGFGEVERYYASRLPGMKFCLGIDLAEGAINVARERARGMNITYVVADLNNYVWEENHYDLVIANGALHHLSNLEAVLSGIHRAMKPGGLFYSCEYVGPSHMDHSPRQLQIINAAAFLLPPELRVRKGVATSFEPAFRVLSWAHLAAAQGTNSAWPAWKRALALVLGKTFCRDTGRLDFGLVHVSPKRMLLRIDPSEAVRSADIIPIMKQIFPSAEIRPFGGGILQHALDVRFYDNFDPTSPAHFKTFELLCEMERHFEATGEIGIENAFIVATK